MLVKHKHVRRAVEVMGVNRCPGEGMEQEEKNLAYCPAGRKVSVTEDSVVGHSGWKSCFHVAEGGLNEHSRKQWFSSQLHIRIIH